MTTTNQQQQFPEPLPAAPNPWRLFTAFNTPGPRWPGALRAALSMLLPGAVALLLGFDAEMVLITAGSCTVIYGEGHPYRARITIMSVVAALLIVGSGMGAFVGETVWGHIRAGATNWWLLLTAVFATAIAAVLVFCANALRLSPPGAFFIVMIASASTMTPRLGVEPLEVAMWCACGALTGIAVGMFPALIHPAKPETNAVDVLEKAVRSFKEADGGSIAKRHQAETALANAWFALADARIVSGGRVIKPSGAELVQRALAAQAELVQVNRERKLSNEADTAGDQPTYVDSTRLAIPHTRPTVTYRLYRSSNWHSHATITTLRVVIASLAASVASIALGFDRPDWAVVSVVMTLQWGPELIPGTIRGVHRMVGSIVGIGLFSLIYLAQPNPCVLLLCLATAQFYAEVFVVRNYAITVIFTTPLALLMGGATHGALGPTLVSRISETALATFFAVAVLWLLFRNAESIQHRNLVRRCYSAMGNLIGALTTKTPAQSLEYRRDLQYELLGERRAIQSLAADIRHSARAHWAEHLDVQSTGYYLLDYANAHADRELTLEEIGELASRVRALSLRHGRN
ncbi:FUSC family protein [Corynebacterium epidermidicanis]|uniref:FUSC family protein n=1 Tax=Corynebacterium epidermidicanis TaxID=1050174 RepID=UPI0006413D41|nr:FUSC family protein [Corynebacterium epidermidicanis]